MRTINRDTKSYILYFLILVISIGALKTVINEHKVEIVKMEIEIEELNAQKENLLRQKQLYEEILELKEELELNLTQQIDILEKDTLELQEENEQLRTIRAKLTAYSPLDNRDGQQAEGNPTRTSIGRRVGRNIAAADPKKLPYGTKLEVPGYGIVEIGDTGGALRNDDNNIRIDLFHNTYPEAMNFGVKNQEIKILEWGGD
ncbi:MAG: 3D domain-containing protein [Tissierella sp.]|nr:3D domain-containing protein [Tissierella sp.]